ncbi:hypothetical protein F5B20DRAFT_596827 [Whalleya microplaca]|nr:hypothetical protein F5B20DRAFT_596827 [Whalleya microplaca]
MDIQYRPRTPATTRWAAQFGPQLLNGCWLEADRAEQVSISLQGLRNCLAEPLHPHLNGLIDEIHITSRLLRDLADQSQVYISRLPTVFDYLNVILPCLSKTLRDIVEYVEDNKRTKESRWRMMYHMMGNELPGTTLPARFIMYNQFLTLLQALLTRSVNFDLNAVESLRLRILQLRAARNMPPPSPLRTDTLRQDEALDFWNSETKSHWAEAIFTQPLPSRREFKKHGTTQACGVLQQLGHLPPLPRDVKILVKRSFDNNRISVIFFLQLTNQAPSVLIRTTQPNGSWCSVRGVHELCIYRKGESSLTLDRWSQSEQRSKPWANLSFLTWEELVLFYCTFVCLKAQSPKMVNFLKPSSRSLRKEQNLFQALILDDGYQHILNVYEDEPTGGWRLQASVYEAELRSCPVWTAFLPAIVPPTNIVRKNKHCIWVYDLQIYTFYERYRPNRQRRGSRGAFKLEFIHNEAAARFAELFSPTPAQTAATESSDNNEHEPEAVSG